MGFIAGAVVAIAWAVFGFWLFPAFFNALKGMFENPDVGTLVGIIGVVVTIGPFVGIGLFLAIFIAAMITEFTK